MDMDLTTAPDRPATADLPSIEDITENFALLDDWDDRYRYVIELGRALAPLSDAEHDGQYKVPGCVSQVWLVTAVGPGPVLHFRGDSDAQIVRGLVAILLAMLSGRTAADILAADPVAVFEQLGLREHLTPQRSNGFRSMVGRIRADAQAAMLQAA